MNLLFRIHRQFKGERNYLKLRICFSSNGRQIISTEWNTLYIEMNKQFGMVSERLNSDQGNWGGFHGRQDILTGLWWINQILIVGKWTVIFWIVQSMVFGDSHTWVQSVTLTFNSSLAIKLYSVKCLPHGKVVRMKW